MAANRLYFMQHGLAVGKADNPARPLSEEGIAQTRMIASRLLDCSISVSAVFHSGKLRARQTAEIIASTLKLDRLAAAENLAPNDDVSLIRQQLDVERALYVGHLPHMEKLVSTLVTGRDIPAVIKFYNSAVVCLEKAGELYQVSWYLSPRIAAGEHQSGWS